MPTHLRRFLPLLLAVCLTPATALAWQAGGDGRVCTLAHREDGVDVILTYDAAGPLYTITVTQPEPWPPAPLFSMIFDGAAPFTITTDRHVLSNGDRSLTVTDRGFGNVLRGLAENTTARLSSGLASADVSLEGAAPEVAMFEDCGAVPSA